MEKMVDLQIEFVLSLLVGVSFRFNSSMNSEKELVGGRQVEMDQSPQK